MAKIYCTQQIEWILLTDERPVEGEEVLLTDFSKTLSGRFYLHVDQDEEGEFGEIVLDEDHIEVYRSEDCQEWGFVPVAWAKLVTPPPF